MKSLLHLIICMGMASGIFSCKENRLANSDSDFVQETSFFGDSTLTIVSSNKSNGYTIKIFQSKDLTLMNLSGGDSINQYVPLYRIPTSLIYDSDIKDLIRDDSVGNKIGTYVREINIPVERKKLGRGVFFMDVNFDGEEELLIECSGHNRTYFDCFDIVNGIPSVAPGILRPMDEEPYNNIVSSNNSMDTVSIHTKFDFKEKTIHIKEYMGCCSYYETWCKLIADDEWDFPSVKVVRKEYVERDSDGNGNVIEKKKIYVRENGELVLKEDKENLY